MDSILFKQLLHQHLSAYRKDILIMDSAFAEAQRLNLSPEEVSQYCEQIKPYIPIIREALVQQEPLMANIFLYALEVAGRRSISYLRQPVVDKIKKARTAHAIQNLSRDVEDRPVRGIQYTPLHRTNPIGSWYDPQVRFALQGQKNGFPFYALYDYYSKKEFPSLSEPHHSHRLEVWRFKDGDAPEAVAQKIASALYNQFPGRSWQDYTLCVIPASTGAKTFTRFGRFTDLVVEYLGVRDGFEAIFTHDHEATKGNAQKDILPFLEFVPADIQGRRIILFDDVKTTGRSFSQCTGELVRLGAWEVTGVFLAQTVSTFNVVPR